MKSGSFVFGVSYFMAKKTYKEKLLDPRWQKKRLQILNRDNFTCCECGDDKNTLHVHHKIYIHGNEPWEYPDNHLVTLCAICHEQEEQCKSEFNGLVHDMLLMGVSYFQLAFEADRLIHNLPRTHPPFDTI